jgi:hypothetical protein
MTDNSFKLTVVALCCSAMSLVCFTFMLASHSLADSKKFRNQCTALGGKVQSRTNLCIKGDTVILRNK